MDGHIENPSTERNANDLTTFSLPFFHMHWKYALYLY